MQVFHVVMNKCFLSWQPAGFEIVAGFWKGFKHLRILQPKT